MAIDILSETLVKMGEASAMLPNRPSISTLWRWRLRGVRGRKLECVTIGNTPYTSVEALQRFAISPVALTPQAIAASRGRSIAQAEQELAKAGI